MRGKSTKFVTDLSCFVITTNFIVVSRSLSFSPGSTYIEFSAVMGIKMITLYFEKCLRVLQIAVKAFVFTLEYIFFNL